MVKGQAVIKISKISSGVPMPQYETNGASGMDLRAMPECDITVQPGTWQKIPTGLRLEIPEGFEGQIRPRSGLALKYGVTVLNAPGTIDSDYRGDLEVILINHGPNDFTVKKGDRIAQLVICPVLHAVLEETELLSSTERGRSGFGSTGI